MGALARNIENIKQKIVNSAIYKMFSETSGAFPAMMNDEPEVGDVGAKVQADIAKAYRKLETNLGVEHEPQKDADGYNKLPNKLKGFEAEVSEAKAKVNTERERGKGGRQRTRVDE